MQGRIGLSHAKGLDVDELGFDMQNLTNARLFRVTEARNIDAGGSEYAIVEFDDNNLENPDSAPLAIGVIYRDGIYVQHAVWNNRIWSILTDDALAVIASMAGLKREDFSQAAFADRLINDTHRQNSDASNITPSPGGLADSDS